MTNADDEAPKILDIPIGLSATGMRKEFDSLGNVEVPADHYWGAQTQRSLQHFDIGHDRMPKEVYHAYGYVKKAAAIVNTAAGRLPAWKGQLIQQVPEVVGRADLNVSVGSQRAWADSANPDQRLRRLLAEFIGMAGLTFVLSGGAAILACYGGHPLQPWQAVLVLSAVSALWLVVAVRFLGAISAHVNPATTLAFALRRDMGWFMAIAVIAVGGA